MASPGSTLHQRKPENGDSTKTSETQNSTTNIPPFSQNQWNCWTQFPSPPTSENTTNEQYKSFTEYADALRGWLSHYHMHQQMTQMSMSMPYYTMGLMAGQQMAQQSPLPHPPTHPAGAAPQPTATRPQNAQQARIIAAAVRQARGRRAVRQEYVIPAIWKRVTAECIDFFLLFAMKLAITILVIEYVGIIDLKKYDIDFLFEEDLDYNAAFTMTSELVALEVINRIFITLFETMCLRRGMAGQIGGSTPGKRIMRLKVVSCTELIDRAGPNQVLVTPATDLGFWNALVRSVIKNFSLAFFFPVCITAYFFQHNRAAYDIISNSVVVEDEQL